MHEITGDLWQLYSLPNSVACITTNGVVGRGGRAIMGKGVALEASKRFPTLSKELGNLIKARGNQTQLLATYRLYIFPTKNHWKDKSDMFLIRSSARALKIYATLNPQITFYLPRPGCGNGQLDWERDVKPALSEVRLPDNVVIVSQ